MKKHPLPTAEDESDRKLLSDIARVGWHLVGIPGDNEGPPFVFLSRPLPHFRPTGNYYRWTENRDWRPLDQRNR